MSFSSTASSFLSLSIALPSYRLVFEIGNSVLNVKKSRFRHSRQRYLFCSAMSRQQRLAATPSKWSIEKGFLGCPGVASIYASKQVIETRFFWTLTFAAITLKKPWFIVIALRLTIVCNNHIFCSSLVPDCVRTIF